MTKTWMRFGWRLGLISLLRNSLRRTVTMRIRVLFISILLTRRRAYFQIRVTFRTPRIRTESTWRLWTPRAQTREVSPDRLAKQEVPDKKAVTVESQKSRTARLDDITR